MVLMLAAGGGGGVRDGHSPTYFACLEGSLYFVSFSSHVFYWVNMPSRLHLVVVGGCIAGANSSPRAFVPSAPEVIVGLTFWDVF